MSADDVLDLAVRLAGRPLFFDEAQDDEDERWLNIAAERLRHDQRPCTCEATDRYRYENPTCPQHRPAPRFAVIVCRDCDDAEIPFPSAAERGRWASTHTEATGHRSFRVFDR